MRYAQGTEVSTEKSRAEIESTLKRYGAHAFGYMVDARGSVVMFKVKDRAIRILVPGADGSKLKRRPGQAYNFPTDNQRAAWVEKENRRRWRALLLVIKSKLEAIASGIATFEDEFLPYTVMANGQTVGEWAAPQLTAMGPGQMWPQLPASTNEGKNP